jgi:hypothetical protein
MQANDPSFLVGPAWQSSYAALLSDLDALVTTAGTPRDVASALNATLTQTLRQASMKASMMRKVVLPLSAACPVPPL